MTDNPQTKQGSSEAGEPLSLCAFVVHPLTKLVLPQPSANASSWENPSEDNALTAQLFLAGRFPKYRRGREGNSITWLSWRLIFTFISDKLLFKMSQLQSCCERAEIFPWGRIGNIFVRGVLEAKCTKLHFQHSHRLGTDKTSSKETCSFLGNRISFFFFFLMNTFLH